jgi:hypothetical protein
MVMVFLKFQRNRKKQKSITGKSPGALVFLIFEPSYRTGVIGKTLDPYLANPGIGNDSKGSVAWMM